MSSLYELEPDRVNGSGFIILGTAGENIGDRALVYRGAAGTWLLADADAVATLPVLGLSIGAVAVGRRGTFLRMGYIGLASWTWVVNGRLYASQTAGELTQTPPPAPATAQAVGVAIESDHIDFDPFPSGGAGAAGNVTVRVNTGANVGTRPRLNLIDGLKMAVAAVDDGVGNEVDITFTVNEVSGEPMFFSAPNPDGYTGTHVGEQMLDGVDVTSRMEFVLPTDFDISTWDVDVLVIPEGNGNLRRGVATNFGAVCAGEGKATHSDSIAAGQVAVTLDEIECISITAALTDSLPNDLVGLEFTRYGGNVLDTVGAVVFFIGVIIRRP